MKLTGSKYDITLTYCTSLRICFDNHFYAEARPKSLEKAILEAHADMDFYGFVEADIIDSETGEVLAMIKKDGIDE